VDALTPEQLAQTAREMAEEERLSGRQWGAGNNGHGDATDFARSTSGRIQANSLDNIRLALVKLETSLRYDAFAQQVFIDGAPADDVSIDRLWISADDACGFRPSKDLFRTVVMNEARRRPIHPVRAYLDALTWDGTPRLDNWLATYAGAIDGAYVRAVGALPLIAAVRRVREPGAQFDELLVLESQQGTLKSTALRTLCPVDAWFSDDLPLGVDSKQVIERTSGKWIVEAAEMHGNRGREAEQLKAFLSRRVDGPVRLAYDRLPTSIPRQFVLIGTTNATAGYLKDSTGARRFWPVRVRRFDVEALGADRDQLWAEAAVREAQGESIRLASDLWTAAGAHQEERRRNRPVGRRARASVCARGRRGCCRCHLAGAWRTGELPR
jgi:predicted P-loop ATPase